MVNSGIFFVSQKLFVSLFFPNMKKIIALFIILLAISVRPVKASGYIDLNFHDANSSAKLLTEQAGHSFIVDERYLKLHAYLTRVNSPLADYSAQFISSADKYGIDWRLLPAISGLESGFATQMIPGTYNAYGWGGGYIGFKDWHDSIETVSKALKENYYDRGYNTPEKIASVYAPPCNHWAFTVAKFMNEISTNI